MKRIDLRAWIARAGAIALVGAGLGLLARLVGDRTPPSAVLIYATPWLVLLLAGLVGVAGGRRGWKWLGLVPLGWGLAGGIGSWRTPGPAATEARPGETLSIATWNAARKLDDSPAQWHFDSDLVAVIESGDFNAAEWQAFRAATPKYDWHRSGTGMLLGIRHGKLLASQPLGEHNRYRGRRELVEVKGWRLVLVLADIESRPWMLREPAIRGLFAAADSGTSVVLGDFNTPPQGKSFRVARERNFRLANDAQSSGFRETWPFGLPLHTLDQIWAGPGLEVISARQERRNSDHALVEAIVKITTPYRPSK